MAAPPPARTGYAGPARTHPGAPGGILEISTDGVRPAERLDFWNEAHFNRMTLSRADAAPSFSGRIRRFVGLDTHMLEHASDAINAVRSHEHIQRDGIDYVSLNLMVDCSHALVEHGGSFPLQPGSLQFIDSARPVKFRYGRTHTLSIFLPRRRVYEAIGGDPGMLAPDLLAHHGIGAVLRSHMRMAVQQAATMSPDQRVVVISSCADMALALLQAARRGTPDLDQFSGSMHEAARALIESRCTDPQFDPGAVAAALGCSRASLYRLFAQHGESVAAVIRSARLERARRMILSELYAQVPLAEIAFRSGFVDQASFNRMFKRLYGMAPGEVRLKIASKPLSGT